MILDQTRERSSAFVGADRRVGPRAHTQVRPYKKNTRSRIIRMPWVLLFCVAFNSAGCISQRAVLVNDRGEEMTCEVTGWGAFPALVASNTRNQCITDAENRGYRLKQNE